MMSSIVFGSLVQQVCSHLLYVIFPPIMFLLKLEKDDDPFCDIDVDAMEESKWVDEEKMKELDELMPVITEHF